MKFRLRNTLGLQLEVRYPEIFKEFKVKIINKEDFFNYYDIEISSLEELLKLMKLTNEPLVLSCGTSFFEEDECREEIEIYDDYRE